MRSCLRLATALALTIGSLMGRAAADDTCTVEPGVEVREQAKVHYNAGLSAYQARRYREAVDQLLCASRLMPSAAFAYNIAVTYEAMGDVATALRWYRQHRRERGARADSSELNAKIADLEAQLQARGVQQVTLMSTPEGAALSIDDKPLGLTPFTLELTAGQHRYRAKLAGHEPAQGSFELRIDRSLEVRLELPALAAAAPAPEAPLAPAPHEPVEAPSRSIGTWTWISLGTGTLLLGGALAFELRRAHLDDELRSVPQADYPERYDAMTTQQTTARVLAGLGGAALISGGVLMLLDLSHDGSERQVALSACAAGGLCMDASGVF
jgi:hypothetical protein